MFRYYVPECGWFVSQDPIGLKGGWNRYHSPLNPITDSDPLGLITCGADRGDSGKLLRWKMVENNCVSECSFMPLPTKSNGFACWNCVNECK
ncbi:hypothetical protein OJ67_003667 [Salmonella enterica subsp. enterica serovar Saintpaul]|nr:hypothetical protein [Salmonella enterica subsp. enterica serovar Saintpaul]